MKWSGNKELTNGRTIKKDSSDHKNGNKTKSIQTKVTRIMRFEYPERES